MNSIMKKLLIGILICLGVNFFSIAEDKMIRATCICVEDDLIFDDSLGEVAAIGEDYNDAKINAYLICLKTFSGTGEDVFSRSDTIMARKCSYQEIDRDDKGTYKTGVTRIYHNW